MKGDLTLGEMINYIRKRKVLIIALMLVGIIGALFYCKLEEKELILTLDSARIDPDFFLHQYFSKAVLPIVSEGVSIRFKSSPFRVKGGTRIISVTFKGSREAVKKSLSKLKNEYLRFRLKKKVFDMEGEIEDLAKNILTLKEKIELLKKKRASLEKIKEGYPVIENSSLNISNPDFFPPQLQKYGLEYKIKMNNNELLHLKYQLTSVSKKLKEYENLLGEEDVIAKFCEKEKIEGIPWEERLPICQRLNSFDTFSLYELPEKNIFKFVLFWGIAGLLFGIFLALFIEMLKIE